MLRKRCISLALAFYMIFLAAVPCFAAETSAADTSPSDAATSTADISAPIDRSGWTGEMNVLSASDLASRIKVGWNLGESLDAWSSDAGYDDYHNSNAYQMVIRYDDANGIRSTSIANSFNEDNKCSFVWQTGLITSEPNDPLGDIGFEIWNLTVEDGTEVTVKCTKAQLIRRNKVKVDFEELLGEHTLTITKYGTVACLTEWFPSNLSRTYGIMDGTFEVALELVDFPQKNYGKPEYFETLWNNPLTTYDIIREVKAAGFNAVRVPVTYFNHIVSKTDAIDAGWLDRVQTVVDYVMAQDMYCIIDMHNDGSTTGWLRVNTSQSDAVQTKYEKLWQQIATRFRDYNERLIFQGFNELTNASSEWGYPGAEDTAWVNGLNQKFVDTVRATGGNNGERCLMLMPYAGSYDKEILSDFKLPRDKVPDRLLVSVNAYYPADFSWELNDASYTDVVTWGSDSDKADMDSFFADLDSALVSKGMPVVITEFGTDDKDNPSARVAHAAYYVEAAKRHNIPCFWWDDGDMLLRKTLTWSSPEVVDAMVDAVAIHIKRVDAEVGDAYFSGDPVEPELRLSRKSDKMITKEDGSTVPAPDIVLKPGRDYDIEFENNIDLGSTGRIIVTGKGEYTGIRVIEFEITEKPFGGVFGRVARSNPDVPLVIMLTMPLMLAMIGLYVYRRMRSQERARVDAIIAASLRDDDFDPDDGFDDDIPAEKPQSNGRAERRAAKRSKKAAKDQPAPPPPGGFDDDFDDFGGFDDDFGDAPPASVNEAPPMPALPPNGFAVSTANPVEFGPSDDFDDDF